VGSFQNYLGVKNGGEISQQATKVLLQAWHDVVIFGCGSVSAAVPAGQTSLNFCLLSFAFISLFNSGWGQTQQ